MSTKRRCPNCGKAMKQQFISLKHCSCGISWKKDTGYFERMSNMTFSLEKSRTGKKATQIPVIRIKNED